MKRLLLGFASTLALAGAAHAQSLTAPPSCPLSAVVAVNIVTSGSTWGCQFAQSMTASAAASGPVAIGLRNDLTVSGNASNWTGSTDFLSANFTNTYSTTGTMPTSGGVQSGVYVNGTGSFTGIRGFVSHNEVNGASSITLFKGFEFVLTNNVGTISNLRWIDIPDTRSTPGGGSIGNEWAFYSPDPNAKMEVGGPIRSLTSFQLMSAFGTNSTKITAPADGAWLVGKSTGAQLTVATLPSCTSALDGAKASVTDATATTFASAVAGSGSNHVPVYCDGSGTPTWKIG